VIEFFLHTTDGEDIWEVFNGALHFFGMIFNNIHRWSVTDIRYERGAWLRVYGAPAHAWNEDFFRLCVMETGRFIRTDECTVDKARMDFARILISTSHLEIVNKTSEFSIDGCLYVIKLVEEWGCNLGEDAFLREDESESVPETSPQFNDANDMEEVQGEWELDDLVTDLHKEWSQQNDKKGGKQLIVEDVSKAVTCDQKAATCTVSKAATCKQQNVTPTLVLEPVLCPVDTQNDHTKQCNKVQPSAGTSRPINKGPWSLDWVSNVPIEEGGTVFTAAPSTAAEQNSLVKIVHGQTDKNTNKKSASKHSVGFLKRIARMPSIDRKEILKIIKYQERKRKARNSPNNSKAAIISTSNSSKNSSPTVNNDCENWVLAHGKAAEVAKDVKEIGKVIGVKFRGDSNNSFNLLSKAGRKELQAARVGAVESEEVGGFSGDGVGC
jgi:hypothetical protein